MGPKRAAYCDCKPRKTRGKMWGGQGGYQEVPHLLPGVHDAAAEQGEQSGVCGDHGFERMQIKHFDYSIAKSIGDINRKNYPERLGKVFVINYPMFYHVVWFVVRNWLAKKTQSKIKFKDSKKI